MMKTIPTAELDAAIARAPKTTEQMLANRRAFLALQRPVQDAAFLARMETAAAKRTPVTGADVDRLRALAGFPNPEMPAGWSGTVHADNVRWMAERARKIAAKAEG